MHAAITACVGTSDKSCQLFRMGLEVTLWTPALKSHSCGTKHLHTNMRMHLHVDEAAHKFASQLLAIGDSKYPIGTSPDIIQLSENIGPLSAA